MTVDLRPVYRGMYRGIVMDIMRAIKSSIKAKIEEHCLVKLNLLSFSSTMKPNNVRMKFKIGLILLSHASLTQIWMGFLGVRFTVGEGDGGKVIPCLKLR